MTVPSNLCQHQPRPGGRPRLTVEEAVEDLAEFELIVPFSDVSTACERIGMHPRSMIRRYRLLDRPVPPGLWSAAHSPRPGLDPRFVDQIRGDVADLTPASVSELLDFAAVLDDAEVTA